NPVHAHEPTRNWERDLHHWLEAKLPCATLDEFHRLWPEVIDDVRAHGINVGPGSFAGFNDGDSALVRTIWCLVRHLKPEQVVETGVGHGFPAGMILEALSFNGCGILSSIDRPPLDPAMRNRVGVAVPKRVRHRWNLLAGSSRRCLPGLLSRLGSI